MRTYGWVMIINGDCVGERGWVIYCMEPMRQVSHISVWIFHRTGVLRGVNNHCDIYNQNQFWCRPFFAPGKRQQHFSSNRSFSPVRFSPSLPLCCHLSPPPESKKLPNTYTISLKPGILCSDLTTARRCELCGGTRQTEKERHSLEACSVGPLTWMQSKQNPRSFLLEAATRNYTRQKRDNVNATGHFHAATKFCFGVWF